MVDRPVRTTGDTVTEPDPRPKNGGSPGRLLDRLLRKPWEFEFFQAVWLLERSGAEAEPVGHRGPVRQELLRFRPSVSLGFPATDVSRLTAVHDPDTGRRFYRMEVTFLGLYGVATPLPLHYAIGVLREAEPIGALNTPAGRDTDPQATAQPVSRSPHPAEAAESTPTRDFLDILHHRLIGLFYRSWAKYRYHATFGTDQHDDMTGNLRWLIGHSPQWSRTTLGVDPVRMIRYAGFLTQHPRSAVSVEQLLGDYWEGIPVEVSPFTDRWVPLHLDDLNRLGMRNARLGVDLTVGEQVFDLSGAFTIRLGPMDWETYLSFLPGTRRFAETCALIRLALPDPLAFRIELRLKEREIPPTSLSSTDGGSMLGFTTWSQTTEMPETSVIFDGSTDLALDPQAGEGLTPISVGGTA